MRQLMFFIEDCIKIFFFVLILIGIFEFVTHGASWEGLYLAHEKHKRLAYTQMITGE